MIPFSLEPLSHEMSVFLHHLLQSFAEFPFSRVNLTGRLDYELLARASLYNSNDRAQIAGLSEPSVLKVSWQQMTGYRSSGGVFLHIIPDTGPAGILLPVGACPIYGGKGAFCWDGKTTSAMLMFRKHPFPKGGNLSGVGPDVMATADLGYACGQLLNSYETEGGRFTIPLHSAPRAAQLCHRLQGIEGLAEVTSDGKGVQVRPEASIHTLISEFVRGPLPARFLMLGGDFYEGMGQALVENDRLRTAGIVKAGTILRLLWRSGLGTKIRISATKHDISFNTKIYTEDRYPLSGGMSVTAKMAKRLRSHPDHTAFLHQAMLPDMCWKRCRIAKVMISGSSAFPTAEGFSVHPSGLVYHLAPGEPFFDTMS